MIEKLKSRKLLIAVITAVLVTVGTSLGIDEATVTKLVGLAASYIVGQGIADAGAGKSQTSKQ
jgi:hypothetical protein